MAAESITFVLNRLADQAVKEAALLRGVDKDIRLLRDKLEWIQTFIQHADQERRKRANNYIALWVRQTRDVAHDAEDVLDEFLRKADLDRLAAGRSRWGRWLWVATTLATQVAVRHDLREKMDGIKDRLQEISDNVDKYWRNQLSPDELSATAAKSSGSTAAWYADEAIEVVGFEEEYKALEGYLLSEDERRSVIPIVGESGIGKSTLAWKVYDSLKIRKEFDVRAWINVPPQIKDRDVLYFIYRRICLETVEDKSLSIEDIHDALSKYLGNKRYLVMVDGLANFTTLNSILHSLPKKNRKSRVMIITRLDDKEASNADPEVIKPVKMNKLRKKDSKRLFCHKVFGPDYFRNKVIGSGKSLQSEQEQLIQSEKEEPQPRQQKQQPKQEQQHMIRKALDDMYEVTEGLPLAIVVLAGLLRTKNIEDWGKVFEQLKSSEEPKRVKRILALSFDDLPSRLKSCFLYFAGMPENLIFNAKRIVRLWAAEGFLKPKMGKTMEDVGETYLKELISRGMLQVVEKDLNGGVWRVSIHDRLHNFAKSEAQDASFMEVHDNAHVLAAASTRRLYLQNYTQSYISLDNTSFPKLRSILCDFAEERPQENLLEPTSQFCGGYLKILANKNARRRQYHALRFLPVSKFLRVIDFRGLRINKLPSAIGDMIHVRYLGLRCQSLDALPSSIERLINLQTLDLKRSKVAAVAPGFWKIPTLRHVVANKLLQLPKSVGAVNNIQTLTGLVCSTDPWTNSISPLDNMVHLRYLELSGLTDSQHWKGLAAAFKKLESLLYLNLEGDGIPASDLFTNFTLRRLQILELTGKIFTQENMEEKQYTLPNLTRIMLKKTKVNQKFMNNIGLLPSLMELVLSDESYVGDKLVFSDEGFNNVRNLVIANLPQELEWEIRPHSIPNIRTIALGRCNMTIKLQLKAGETGLKSLMQHLEAVVVWNIHEKIQVEPKNSDFEEKISKVTMKTLSEDLTSAMRRTGRSRTGTVEGDMP